jgi:hypothetical protein
MPASAACHEQARRHRAETAVIEWHDRIVRWRAPESGFRREMDSNSWFPGGGSERRHVVNLRAGREIEGLGDDRVIPSDLCRLI